MLLSTLKDLLKAAVSPPRHPAEGKLATRNGPTSSDLSITKEEAECRRTLDSLPNSAEAHNKLGALLKDTSRLAEAEAAFRRAISLHGDNVVAHYNLGIVLA